MSLQSDIHVGAPQLCWCVEPDSISAMSTSAPASPSSPAVTLCRPLFTDSDDENAPVATDLLKQNHVLLKQNHALLQGKSHLLADACQHFEEKRAWLAHQHALEQEAAESTAQLEAQAQELEALEAEKASLVEENAFQAQTNLDLDSQKQELEEMVRAAGDQCREADERSKVAFKRCIKAERQEKQSLVQLRKLRALVAKLQAAPVDAEERCQEAQKKAGELERQVRRLAEGRLCWEQHRTRQAGAINQLKERIHDLKAEPLEPVLPAERCLLAEKRLGEQTQALDKLRARVEELETVDALKRTKQRRLST